ncbi:hypothetical protein CLCR_03387 [Cladophialophora carrionii]|uniref:Uncharacterized protein n=1 Tax=Cladophialophora carrionii TaxID=86049 RepID=A0A1C1CGP4_9EURO|nr:hypothetical protein CLCR_03387 [Cladophialophora carrionii]
MCLYNSSRCRAHTPQRLLGDLTKLSPGLRHRKGLVRCIWYEALAEASRADGGVKFPVDKDVCPYVVIRHNDDDDDDDHDAILQQEDVEMMSQAVLFGGLTRGDRGCPQCWRVVSSRGWVGRMPTDGEKLKYLYTSSSGPAGGDGGSGSGVDDNEVHGCLTRAEDTDGKRSGVKRTCEDEEEAASEQGSDAEDEATVRSLDVRPLKKSRIGSTDSNKQNRRDSAMASSSCSRPRDSSSAASSPPIVCNSISAKSSSSKSGFVKRTVTTAMPAVGEVIPPRPDQINKSESETYSITPVGDGRNWNPFKDTMFGGMGLQSTSRGKRWPPAQEPLQAARRQMEFELEANLNQLSTRPSAEAENILTGARGPAGGGAKKRSESTGPLASKSKPMGRMDPRPARRSECFRCGHTFTVTSIKTTTTPDGGLVCNRCFKECKKAEKKSGQHKRSHGHISISAGAADERHTRESTDGGLRDGCQGRRDGHDDARDEVSSSDDSAADEGSSSDMCNSEASSGATPGRSRRPHTDGGEYEISRHKVTKLRRENARLRTRLADALDSYAAASRREARLLRQLSRYEGAGEGAGEAQNHAEVKADDGEREEE